MKQYYFDSNDNFIIEDFQKQKTFSSFLPGIAGIKGIPIWSFYVNRGQGISGFGIKDKNNPIMEFFPANSSYQYVSTYGFRTFIKDLNNHSVIEAFKDAPQVNNATKMIIKKDSFIIEDHNIDSQMIVRVTYSTLSNVAFGGLVRHVEIKNNSKKTKDLEVVDGMPALIPFGVENQAYKEMSNLMRSWMEVTHTDKETPYYKLRSSTKDEALVSISDEGYYYLNSCLEDSNSCLIYDPSLVFDYQSDLQYPIGFINSSYKELANQEQVYANKVPSAFQLVKFELAPGETKVINSVIGYTDDYSKIYEFSKAIEFSRFIEEQISSTKVEINNICNELKTKTGIKAYDEYISQSYLDNILRGGKPLIFEGNHVYHVFSRKHGDPERDYNFFSLEASMYSQGNGNYRDVCQNRRNDVVIEPGVEDFNIWMFYNLVQADGYNPLSIKGTTFIVEEDKLDSLKDELKFSKVNDLIIDQVIDLVSQSFTPGSLMTKLSKINSDHEFIELMKEVLESSIKYSKQVIEVDFGEGFWSDHFTYNQDLIESFEFMYPDKVEATLFDDYKYAFFNAPYYCVPRDLKYNLVDEKVRQYEAIAAKEKAISTWMTDENGQLVETNLMNKLVVLALTKFMNLDPFALGLEMEGDKPGWNDALNGLPGLFGSGMSESIELKRIVDYVIDKLSIYKNRVNIELLTDVSQLLFNIASVLETIDKNELHTDEVESYKLWNQLNTVKETYREQVKYYLHSSVSECSIEYCLNVFKTMSVILDKGIKKAKAIGNGVLPSYFVNEVTKFSLNNSVTLFGKASVTPLAFTNRALPFFLEGPARYLKTLKGDAALDLYEHIKKTDIFDKGLEMYKTSESLESETMEIGRIRAFTPGWLERESVFLHMTYKYLLSTLESGLYEQYFADIKTNMIPMLNPQVYGRATTENSSFIASSVNPDKNVIGQGFVARLSGSTAEAISMWIKMFIGNIGFTYENQELVFTFAPVLTNDFFDENGRIEFKLFKDIKVIYINKTGKASFGKDKAVIESIVIDGFTMKDTIIRDEWAKKLRLRQCKEIVLTFK